MPLDAICLRAVIEEMEQHTVGCRIEKVYQPDRDEILLTLRGVQGQQRLLLCVSVSAPRIHLVDNTRDNPAAPPMFCMLLRKHIQGAKIAAVKQPGLERIATLELDTTDELGIAGKKYLHCELMGKHSNVILCDGEGRVLDALRRLEGDAATGKRQILPGLFYQLPPVQQGKKDPLAISSAGIAAALDAALEDKGLDRWLLDSFFGLSPLLCRELAFRATGDCGKSVRNLTAQDKVNLCSVFSDFIKSIVQSQYCPYLLSKTEDQTAFDFTFLPITQYASLVSLSSMPSFSALLSQFYERKEHAERLRRRGQDTQRAVTTARDRLARKLAAQRQELLQTEQRDDYRRIGDLITANLYQIEPGARTVCVTDYYADGCPQIELKLDVRLSPQQNAQRYFKLYNKAKTAEAVLTKQIAEGEADLFYLESVLEAINEAENEQDLLQLREELRQTGYLSMKQQRGRKQLKSKPIAGVPFHYRTSDGFDVYAGKNNLQNDLLTLKTAYRNDIWFHTQKIHGSHVILVCDGKKPTDTAMTEAACIAAYHSKARTSAQVPVDYSEVRNIKKPAGAKPGFVIYHVYQTAYVTPEETMIERLRVR